MPASSPELQALLESNEAPLDSQIPAVHNVISTSRARLATLQAERNRLQEADDVLREQFESLKAQMSAIQWNIEDTEEEIDDYRAILSPIRRIPPEIVCEIFQWASLEGYTRTVKGRKAAVAPWHLTHICRAWRRAARADPRLWSCVRIQVPDARNFEYLDDSDDSSTDSTDPDESDTNPTELDLDIPRMYSTQALKSQLRLSSRVDLHVLFDTGRVKQSPHLDGLLNILLRHSERWSHLTLTWSRSRTLQIMANTSVLRLPHLRCVRLLPKSPDQYDLGDPESWPSKLGDLFSAAPVLHKLEISAHIFKNRRTPLLLPAHQLTHLRLRMPSRVILRILPLQANSLVDVAFDVEAKDAGGDVESVIELPRVRRLCMTNDWFSRYLVAPNLETLHLAETMDNAIKFLDRSRCHNIQRLELHHLPPNPNLLIALLRRLNTITHLTINTFAWSQNFDAESVAFLRAMSSPEICPKLTSLEFRMFYMLSFVRVRHEPVCDMVESRCNDAGLKVVRILPEYNWPRQLLDRFDVMRRAGVDVNELSEDYTLCNVRNGFEN
ncbi:hypothetical protein R3P38DRAFT_3492981 [Favolaschia claudopus]|uniref:F-box domain-containing protein n=1 Tax=Favolaschia claudopus TaxID=2862362 RepID=A0AAW0EGC8_9AGAR